MSMSHKQSLAGPSSGGLTPSLQTLLQKQQEHAGLQALKEASGELLGRAEELAKMSNIMADGGEAIGAVLRNWPHVFSILNLFEPPAPDPTSPGGTPLPFEQEEQEQLPQVVRLPYTENPKQPAQPQ